MHYLDQIRRHIPPHSSAVTEALSKLAAKAVPTAPGALHPDSDVVSDQTKFKLKKGAVGAIGGGLSALRTRNTSALRSAMQHGVGTEQLGAGVDVAKAYHRRAANPRSGGDRRG